MRKVEHKKPLTRKQRRILKKRRQRRMRILCAAVLVLIAIILLVAFLIGRGNGNKDVTAQPTMQSVTAAPTAVTEQPDTAEQSGEELPLATEMIPDPLNPEPVVAVEEQPTLPPEIEIDPTVEPENISVTITAAGDCTLGGDAQGGYGVQRFAKVVKKNGYDYFLKNVRDIFESDDITIVNLEGPLTTSRDARSGRKFLFKGDPEYVKILSGSSVEVCTTANNHALDFGKSGHEETLEVLESAGIGACGYDAVCFEEVRGVRVGFMGLTEWDYTLEEVHNRVADMRKQCDLLIVSIHWGEEKDYKGTALQKSYGHEIIDAGADLVLGHHSHVVGGIEEYNGKYILYSLGNFCFGGNGNPSDKDTMIFQQRFEIAADGTVQDAGINIIPCSVSSVKNSNNFQPTPLEGDEYTRVLNKIGKYSSIDDPIILEPEY